MWMSGVGSLRAIAHYRAALFVKDSHSKRNSTNSNVVPITNALKTKRDTNTVISFGLSTYKSNERRTKDKTSETHSF